LDKTTTETWIDGTAQIVIDVIGTIVNGIDDIVATGIMVTTIVNNLFPITKALADVSRESLSLITPESVI
jgi:hypothetical protein